MPGAGVTVARRKSRRLRKAVPATESPQCVRVMESPLARLKRRGALNVWELTAADEIIAAYHMAAGAPVVRDADLGVPSASLRPGAADEQAARRSDLSRVFAQWQRELNGTAARAAVLGILVRETPLREIERRHAWRNGTATRYLIAGLRAFAALRGNTPRWARDWKWAGKGQ